MISVLRAEWQKMVGNRWTTGFLIWIFPVGSLALVAGLTLLALLSPRFRTNFTPLLWTDNFMVPWTFANNLFGRTFLLGFTAVTFAGEYQWSTWKNIVPRQRRSLLILAKFINLTVLILLAFGLMSLIFGFGYGLLTRIAGHTYGPDVTGEVLREFLSDYALLAVLTFISVIIASIYAALSAMLMRSILGGIMVGVGISIVEPLVIPLTMSMALMFNSSFFLHLGRFSPYYSIENVKSWLQLDQGLSWLEVPFQRFDTAVPIDSMSFSVAVLTGWLVVGIGLVLYLFQRQDITA